MHLSHTGVGDPVAIASVSAPQGRVLMTGALPGGQISTLTILAQTGQRGASCTPDADARLACDPDPTALPLLASASVYTQAGVGRTVRVPTFTMPYAPVLGYLASSSAAFFNPPSHPQKVRVVRLLLSSRSDGPRCFMPEVSSYRTHDETSNTQPPLHPHNPLLSTGFACGRVPTTPIEESSISPCSKGISPPPY